MKTVYIQTLGCEKNTVDSEIIIGILEKAGYTFTTEPQDADIIIVNTCAFINDAKKESIDTLFQLSVYREHGKCKRLIATGCMPQRYNNDLQTSFKEIDAFVGTSNLENILRAVEQNDIYVSAAPARYEEYTTPRVHTGAKGSAFIRIADGCFSSCSFCAIPLIRGAYRSRTIEHIAAEAQGLVQYGVKEINLIAQETSCYGIDLYGKKSLDELLKKIDTIDGIEWIRVLYQNPAFMTEELLDTIASSQKVLPYFDIPLQHCNAQILKNMKRAGDAHSYMQTINGIRARFPESVIRTSLIVGFPGEGEPEFNELRAFINEVRFDRLGIFVYSEEEGTAAVELDLPRAGEEEAMYRRETLMHDQLEISSELLERYKGKNLRVLVEQVTDDSVIGRSWHSAPEIDGQVIVNRADGVKAGDMIDATIDQSNEHDLYGTVVEK